MKDQARIQLRTRRSAKIRPETEIINKKLKNEELPVAAFKPYETVKPEKKPQPQRRITRSSKALKQSTLTFTQQEDKIEKKEQNERVDDEKQKEITTVKQKEVKSISNTEEKELVANAEEKSTTTELEQKDEASKDEETTVKRRASSTPLQNRKRKTRKTDIQQKTTLESKEETTLITKEDITEKSIEVKEVNIPIIETKEETPAEKHVTVTDYEDTPSPPSSNFPEPLTPPTHAVAESSSRSAAPYKTYLTSADKQRIEYEKTTLIRLRRSLDIAMTDRLGRNIPCLYHKMEAALRNSTSRSISLSHVCQIMYVAPKLYTIEPVEIRNFGGKATEAYLLGFGEGLTPTTGQELEKRANILEDAVNKYFIEHTEFDAVIPQIELPKMSNVVDKDKWIKEAELPAGMRRLFEAHEANKKAEEKKKEVKPTPKGTVAERMAALKARLAEKKKAKDNDGSSSSKAV